MNVRLNSPVLVTVKFSEPVSGFTVDDIMVGNGTASSFYGSDGDDVYTFDVKPNALVEVTVDIAADVATDGESNPNSAAQQLSLGIPYDFDGSGGIGRAETIAAIRDYFDGNINRGQAIAVIRLYFSTPAEPGPGTPEGDRAALVALHNATDGPNWGNNTGWLTDVPLGQWYGVTTDDSGRVTELILNDNGLSGSIPAVLGNLSSLKVLNLANPRLSCTRSTGQRWVCTSSLPAPNRLTGAIPADLARLANLEQLVLDGNQLSGTIPAWLGNLSKLERLSLRGQPAYRHDTGGLGPPDQLEISESQLQSDGREYAAADVADQPDLSHRDWSYRAGPDRCGPARAGQTDRSEQCGAIRESADRGDTTTVGPTHQAPASQPRQ